MFQPKRDITPQPGKYEYKSYIGEGPKYSFRDTFDIDGLKKEKRHQNAHKVQPNPGPGHYNIPEDNKGPKYTIRCRYKKRKSKRDKVPGVGEYELRKEKSLEVPSYKFDQEQRVNQNMNMDALKNPGPGHYDIQANISTKGPSFSFGKATRPISKLSTKTSITNKERSITPGPGQYNHKQYIGKEGISLSFYKEKYSHFEPNNNPAPGQYLKSIQYSASTASYSFSKSQRRPLTSSQSAKQMINGELKEFITPGPDKYNPNPMLSSTRTVFPSWKIGNEPRDNDKKAKDPKYSTPGPGKYTITNGLFPEGAKYTISEKIIPKGKVKAFVVPGPGQYNAVTVHKENEPSYSIGKSLRDDDLKKVIKDNYPAPNKYKVHDYASQGITFPKMNYDDAKRKVTPGPGSYKIPCRFNDINNITRERGFWNPTFKYV